MPGGEYEVYDWLPGFGALNILGTFRVDPNADGVTMVDVTMVTRSVGLTARQKLRSVTSGFSLPLTLRDPQSLPAPQLPYSPLFECGLATVVSGHQPGDQVMLFSSLYGTRFTIPSAFGTQDYVPAGGPRSFQAGEIVDAQYQTCEGPPQVSPRSASAIVALYPSPQLPPVTLTTESLIPGVSRFVTTGTINGAALLLSLTRAGATTKWSAACGEAQCVAYLPPTLGTVLEGDAIQASQELCSGSEAPWVSEEVKACADSPPPIISPSPQVGDTLVRLSRYPLGATTRVYATKMANPSAGLELIGFAFDTSTVALVRPIKADDRWVIVALDTAACPARWASAWFVGE